MRRGAALLLAAAAVGPTVRPAAGQTAPPAAVGRSLGRLFGIGIATDTVLVADTAVLRIRRAGRVLGYADIVNVRGKHQPITLLVAVDSTAVLRDVDVLVYREPYGGEVAYESWRRQFRGKTSRDPLAVSDDIKGISGATISVNAVTAGVRATLARLTRWHQAGQLP